MLPTKFGVNWPSGLGEEVKSWISDRNDLAIFDLQVTPMLPTKYRVNWPRRSRLLKQLLTPQDARCTNID